MTPQPGDQLGQYRLERLIARGGMGAVYRAHDERLGREVALKLLSPELSEDPLFRSRFEREWRIAASLRHPNIVPVYDAGEWQEQLYIAMQLVEGPDLAALIEREGALPPGRVLAIVSQLAAALDAAHAQGIVHRDVKPGNVLLLEGGAGGGADHVYLADFGLTRRASSASRMTRTGSFLGTLGYIAPEQLKGDPVDARTDEYSLACLAVEMLTGAPPFRRDSEVAQITAHLHEPPPRVSPQRPDLPAALDAVIAQGMAKEPDARYPSCGAFAAAFRQALGGAPQQTIAAAIPHYGEPTLMLAREPTPAHLRQGIVPGSTPTRSRRGSLPVLLALGIVLLLIGGAVALIGGQGLLGGAAATPTPPVVAEASDAAPTSTAEPTTEPTAEPTLEPTAEPRTPRPTETAQATHRPPLTSYQRLLTYVPADIRPYCVPSENKDPSFGDYLAVAHCQLNDGFIHHVRYWRYRTQSDLSAMWRDRMLAIATQEDTRATYSGNCWAGDEGQTTHALGNLQCDRDLEDSTLELRWTDYPDDIYGAVWGYPGDIATLTDWWSKNAVKGGTSP